MKLQKTDVSHFSPDSPRISSFQCKFIPFDAEMPSFPRPEIQKCPLFGTGPYEDRLSHFSVENGSNIISDLNLLPLPKKEAKWRNLFVGATRISFLMLSDGRDGRVFQCFLAFP